MAADSTLGKKSALAIASTLAWLALLVAFLATAAFLTVDNLSHVGNTASTIVKHLSKNPVTIDSLLNEFKKNADAKTVAEIEKNRDVIDSTIASLGGDKAFQDSLANTLNKISTAILAGSNSVTVNFGPLAVAVADKVNAAAHNSVIDKKELAQLKPQKLDLSKQSKSIADVRNKVKEAMLAWLFWFVFLGVLYLLKRWKFVRTAGWQLLSIGMIFFTLRLVVPVVVRDSLDQSALAMFQKDLIPEVLNSLTRPILILSLAALTVGLLTLVVDALVQRRWRLQKAHTSPSVVA